MRRVLVVTREDLPPQFKLVHVKDIEHDMITVDEHLINNSEIIVFNCSLTEQAKIVKNRYGARSEPMDMTSPEGENMILSLILGI